MGRSPPQDVTTSIGRPHPLPRGSPMTSSHVDPPRPRAPPGSAPHFRLSPRSAHAPTLSPAPPPSPPPPAHAPPPADPPRPRHAPGEGKGGGGGKGARDPASGHAQCGPATTATEKRAGRGWGGRIATGGGGGDSPLTRAAPNGPRLRPRPAPPRPYLPATPLPLPTRHAIGWARGIPAPPPFRALAGETIVGPGRGGGRGGDTWYTPPPSAYEGGAGINRIPGSL